MDFADCLRLEEGMVFPIETHDSAKVQPWQRLQRSRGAVQTLGWRTLFCFPAPCFARMSRPGTAHPTHPPGMHHRFRSQSQRGAGRQVSGRIPEHRKALPVAVRVSVDRRSGVPHPRRTALHRRKPASVLRLNPCLPHFAWSPYGRPLSDCSRNSAHFTPSDLTI